MRFAPFRSFSSWLLLLICVGVGVQAEALGTVRCIKLQFGISSLVAMIMVVVVMVIVVIVVVVIVIVIMIIVIVIIMVVIIIPNMLLLSAFLLFHFVHVKHFLHDYRRRGKTANLRRVRTHKLTLAAARAGRRVDARTAFQSAQGGAIIDGESS